MLKLKSTNQVRNAQYKVKNLFYGAFYLPNAANVYDEYTIKLNFFCAAFLAIDNSHKKAFLKIQR